MRAPRLVLVAFLTLAPRLASAAERVDLAWSAPADCPTEEDVGRRIDRKLAAGATGRPQGAERAQVAGRVDRDGARYRLTLAIGGKGERVLVADTCEALAASTAVIVAMSDREDDARDDAPVPAPVATPAPVTPARDEARAPAPPRPAVTRARLAIRLEGAVDSGMLPSPVAGGGIAVGLGSGRVHGEIAAAVFASSSTSVDGDPPRGARFSLVSSSARGCWTATERVELAACAGLHLVRIAGRGEGARQTTEGSSVLAGPELAVSVRVPFTDALALLGGAAVAAPIGRQAFVITTIGAVHTPAPLTIHGFLGPEVSF